MSLASNVKAVAQRIVDASEQLETAVNGLITEVRKSPDDQDADLLHGWVVQVQQQLGTIKSMSNDLKSVLTPE